MSQFKIVVAGDKELNDRIERVLSKLTGDVKIYKYSDYSAAKKHIEKSAIDLIVVDFKKKNPKAMWLMDHAAVLKKEIQFIAIEDEEVSDVFSVNNFGFRASTKDSMIEEALLQIVESVRDEKNNQISNLYARISINDILKDKNVKFPLYVRLNRGKHVKIFNEGDPVEVNRDRIENYKKKGLNSFWFSRDDFQNLFLETTSMYERKAKQDMTFDDKRRLISEVMGLAHESVKIMGVDEEIYETTKEIVRITVETVVNDVMGVSDFKKMLEEGMDIDNAHAIASSVLCANMAVVMGWSGKQNIINLSAAALLQNVGISKLGIDFPERRLKLMSEEQKEIFMKHPDAGADYLVNLGGVPGEVIEIVRQHHEYQNGTGYPRRIKSVKIIPMANMVTIVGDFLDYVNSAPGISPKDALDEVYYSNRKAYNLENYYSLMALITSTTVEEAMGKYKTLTSMTQTR